MSFWDKQNQLILDTSILSQIYKKLQGIFFKFKKKKKKRLKQEIRKYVKEKKYRR